MWVETVVEAEDKDLALDLADTNFEKGDYLEIEMSSEVDYERYWIQDDLGKEFYR
jgi:hypothetical protein